MSGGDLWASLAEHDCLDYELCPDCSMCDGCCSCGDDER